METSNMTNEEWARLNDIQEPRILELIDTEHEYETLVDGLSDYEPVNVIAPLEELIGDLHNMDLEEIEEKLKEIIALAENGISDYDRLVKDLF